MTEYIVIVALIGIAAIAVYQLFGQTVRSQTAGIARELSGQDGAAALEAARNSADKAQESEVNERSLRNYNDNATRGTAGGGGGGGGE
ncbi:integral membrane protein [Caldimonas brevitalea]|uniref:Integral membrane protein n=2 Tax=Caldimonas brevitalea TaxID=413882 RepID=A0A0G3BQG7_9BURK|nr:integral membrane protein [Caldimonas brevitalea]